MLLLNVWFVNLASCLYILHSLQRHGNEIEEELILRLDENICYLPPCPTLIWGHLMIISQTQCFV